MIEIEPYVLVMTHLFALSFGGLIGAVTVAVCASGHRQPEEPDTLKRWIRERRP